MPASLLREWLDYERIEPFGSWRDNWHTALVANILANANRRKNSSPFSMSEFFYKDSETAQDEKRKQIFKVLGSLGKKGNG